MARQRKIGLYWHSVAIGVEFIGTVFLYLDSHRIDAKLPTLGLASSDADDPIGMHAWYWHQGSLGFALVMLGILGQGVILWFENRAMVARQVAGLPTDDGGSYGIRGVGALYAQAKSFRVMKLRYLIGLTVLVVIGTAVAISILNTDRLSAIGSIVAGAGSVLAVTWFSAGPLLSSYPVA